MNLKGRSLLTLLDYSSDEIQYLINLAKRLKEEKNKVFLIVILKGKTSSCYSKKTLQEQDVHLK